MAKISRLNRTNVLSWIQDIGGSPSVGRGWCQFREKLTFTRVTVNFSRNCAVLG